VVTTDAQRRREMLERIVAQALADTSTTRAVAEPAQVAEEAAPWPRPRHYTDLRPACSLEATDRWVLEQRELEDRREHARVERKREERRLIREQQEKPLRAELNEHAHEVVKITAYLGEACDKLNEKIEKLEEKLEQLRSEFVASTRSDKARSTEVVTLPNWRRGDAA
jgi:hypothetical protein